MSRRAVLSLQTVRSKWQERIVITGQPHPGDDNPNATADARRDDKIEAVELQQIQTAIKHSMTNMEAQRAPIVHPAATRAPAVARASGSGTPGGLPAVARKTADYWDPLLDGSRVNAAFDELPAGFRASDGCHDDEGGGSDKDWDALLAEALSVVEWDIDAEILSEANREGFHRSMQTLLKNVLEGNERRLRVRDNNAIFRENVGR